MKEKSTKHPKTRMVKVIFTNGDFIEMEMVYSKDTLQLQSDIFTHRAWQKNQVKSESKGTRAKSMSNKFGDIKI